MIDEPGLRGHVALALGCAGVVLLLWRFRRAGAIAAIALAGLVLVTGECSPRA